jgi:ribonucrease Y
VEAERRLEQLAGMSAARAKQVLLQEIEDQAKHDSARRIRQIEEETKREAERRVRNILSVVMQRLAAGHAAETTVSVVHLASDDMKGRIIGREGRNIRALENITGVDFIIDDTPGAVVLSGFDGVRREIARLTLEKLLLDGRIHPARIEEAYYQTKSELESHIIELGEQGAFDAGVQNVHPELIKLLGRLRFRTSYGQNVLAHSIEVAHLSAMMADELGASPKTARRAALLHDIGKSVTHEIEGPHALVGGDLARRYGEDEAVAHAMEAHHNEVEPQTIEAVIVQAADALSGARPGARGESLELYVKRLRDLEQIATRHTGVDKVYAMQAGREIRVMVAPGAIDDDAASALSYEIAREIEKELEYPGQIKVTVIRESRAVQYAR